MKTDSTDKLYIQNVNIADESLELLITAFSVGITILFKELFKKTILNSSLNSHVYWVPDILYKSQK